MKKHTRYSRGFGLVEALVGAAIISVSLLSLVSVSERLVRISSNTSMSTKAAYLLEEGVDAMRFIRDVNWDTFSSIATNTPHHLTFSNSQWQTTSTSMLVDGIFLRTVTIYPIFRDPVGRIAATGGTVDQDSRRVRVKVEWNARGATTSIEAHSFLGKIF